MLEPGGEGARRDIAAFIIGGAIFMQTLDAQALAIILPEMSRSLGVSPLELNLAITIYYVTAAAFLPVSGWCADRFGARRVFQAAIAAFAVCSVLCGLVQGPIELAAARGAMGVATAGLMPVGRLLLLRTSSGYDLVRRLAYLTIPATIGPLVGPAIAGAFATFGSWRWTFFVNLPISLLGLVLVHRFVPVLIEEKTAKFDALGAMLAGVGLAACVFVIERIGRLGAFAQFEIGLVIFVATCGLAYVMHARRIPKPVLDVSLLRIDTFRAGIVGGLLFRLANASQPFLLALLFQVAFGMTAALSGALVVFTAAGALIVRWFSPQIIRAFGFKPLLVANGVLCVLLGVAPMVLTSTTPFLIVATLLFARGFVQALQITAMDILNYVDVPGEAMSAASSFTATVQQLSQGLSIALAAALVAAAAGHGGVVSVGAFRTAFAGLGAVGLISIVSFALLARDAGAALSGRREN